MRKKLTGDKRKKIIEKVQLLFNRAEQKVVDSEADDASIDHEAQLALETARRLMLQYGLEAHDIESVTVEQVGEAGGGFTVKLGVSNPGDWVKSLAVVIADYFCVKVVYTTSRTSFSKGGEFLYYGVSVGAEAAAYAFESCFNQIRFLSKRYKVDRSLWEKHPAQFVFRTWERYRDISKEEYRKGLVDGFYRRLKKIQAEESKEVTALAISYEKVADDFIEKQPFKLKSERKIKEKPYTADGHYTRGRTDSDKVGITQGLKTDGGITDGKDTT